MSEEVKQTSRMRVSRVNPVVALALAVPLATLAALSSVSAPTVAEPVQSPQVIALERADLGCPALPRTPSSVLVARALDAGAGEVELRQLRSGDPSPTPTRIPAGGVAVAPRSTSTTLVSGNGELAPGLLAARFGTSPLSALPCPAPYPELWFAGLGSRADHASTLELTNPDVGAAVVDISVFSQQGDVEVPELRGLRLAGRTTTRLDLAEIIPRRGDIGVHVVVSRGRATASVVDQVGGLGTQVVSRDWLPGQTQPATTNYLMGLPSGPGGRTLSVLNPGADEVRVNVLVVAPESTFAPAGIEEFAVGPGAIVTVALDQVLAREVRRGALGLLVEGSGPVIASVATLTADDLTTTGPAVPGADDTALLVPPGKAMLTLAGAAVPGSLTLRCLDADGKELRTDRLEVSPARGHRVGLPPGTALVQLTDLTTPLAASVLVVGLDKGKVSAEAGAAVLPASALVTFGLVPAVRPALP